MTAEHEASKIKIQIPLRHSKLPATLHPSGEICPILQEPINSAILPFMPRPYLSDSPMHTALTLECKHTFHAMALIYHWARNESVLCPVCRAGPKNRRLALGRYFFLSLLHFSFDFFDYFF